MKLLQSPHYDKLKAAISNSKTPNTSKKELSKFISEYKKWKTEIFNHKGKYKDIIRKSVKSLNEYKFNVDYNLIYNSSEDFLYRQKGQLKLDNSVIEEFIPLLTYKLYPKIFKKLLIGSINCLSGISFDTQNTIHNDLKLNLRTKDQDFAICKSFKFINKYNTNVALLAAECKTNLDKTMHQEAVSTATDIKRILPNSKYFLICEYLDMKPISSKGSPIDSVLILRKTKRLSSDVRKNFNTQAGRKKFSKNYKEYILKNEISFDVVLKLFESISDIVDNVDNSNDFLEKGFF